MRRHLAALTILAGGLFALGADAHPKLIRTSPEAGAVAASPDQIQLSFSERLMGNFCGAELFMVDMPGMKMAAPLPQQAATAIGADGATLIVTPSKPLAPGSYRVDYHAVAADTHKVTGSFSFSVK